ncbi:MAG: NAD(P)-dependent oxidoreductase [Promethearchaeota archaeon]
MTPIKVLFKWIVPSSLKAYLQSNLSRLSNLKLIFPKDVSEENLLNLAREADVIVGWRPTETLLEHAENLLVFINPGVGVQHLIPMFQIFSQKRNITLINGHGNTFFTAQHAVGLLLSLTNYIIPHHEWMKQGKWRTGDSEAKSIPLRNKTIGFLGYGHINQQVHQLLSNFPVKFAALRRFWNSPIFFEDIPLEIEHFTPLQIDKFLEITDFLIIAVPLTKQTRNLIREKEINLLGEQSFLINISRGPIVNEKDLYLALKHKKIAGAAIDVWYEYQPEPDSQNRKFPYHYPFHDLQNVILSPHRAASPFDDLQRWDEVIENLKRISVGRKDLKNIVDLEREY